MTTQPEQVTAIAKQDQQDRSLAPQSLTPAQMLSIAVQQDAPVEKIEKLMDLQERWEANEARKAFEAAMVSFSSRVPTISKTRKGHNSKYAGLPETVEEIQDLMAECQLSRRWEDREPKKPGNIRIRVVVSHVMGHSVSFELEAGPDIGAGRNDIQAVASTITYLRRITLFGALGLVAGDEVDDDGAGGKKTESRKPKSPGDPENEIKTQFWEAVKKKMGRDLSRGQAATIFTRVQEASGQTSAAECLAYIQREDVRIGKDGTVSESGTAVDTSQSQDGTTEAKDATEGGPATAPGIPPEAQCKCTNGHEFMGKNAATREDGSICCPECGQCIADIVPPNEQPSGVVTCKFGHTIGRDQILSSPVTSAARGELGVCPTCKRNNKITIIKEC